MLLTVVLSSRTAHGGSRWTPTNTTKEMRAAGDFLVGGDAIRAFLIAARDPARPPSYYFKRAGWPIGYTGGDAGKLIAIKRRLIRHIEKLARGSTAA